MVPLSKPLEGFMGSLLSHDEELNLQKKSYHAMSVWHRISSGIMEAFYLVHPADNGNSMLPYFHEISGRLLCIYSRLSEIDMHLWNREHEKAVVNLESCETSVLVLISILEASPVKSEVIDGCIESVYGFLYLMREYIEEFKPLLFVCSE